MLRCLLTVFGFLILVTGSEALSCFICGDSNLDEFGECSRQFQYDCTSYAKRFQPQERIFCRTTRQKEPNNTYTIMKECISERDHYQSFPKKSYPLDEECDLIEIDGRETAYCLCRHSNLCNEKPIADQFIAFEELHPELFGDVEEETAQGAASGPIQPVNQPTTTEMVAHVTESPRRITISMNDRRQQLARGAATAEVDTALSSNAQARNWTPGISAWDMMNQGGKAFVGQAPAMGKESKRIPDLPSETSNDGSSEATAEDAPLKCMQCAQGTLKDERTDCDKQSAVTCESSSVAGENSFCLTRQVLIEEGKHAVEKMCITPKSLAHVFGNRVAPDGCTHLEDENVRICVCSTPFCNREPIYQQIMLSEIGTSDAPQVLSSGSTIPEQKTHPKRCQVCSENSQTDPNEDCTRPIAVDCARQANYEVDTYCLTRQTELSKGVFSLEKMCVTEKQFQENFPDENGLHLGCSVMFDGMIKYCVCDGDLCNNDSVTMQMLSDPKFVSSSSSTTEVTTSLTLAPTTPSSIIQPGSAIRRTSPNEREPSEYSQSLFQETDYTTTTSSYHSSLRAKLEESLLSERQNRWKETEDERLNAAGSSLSRPSIAFLLLVLLTFAALS